ncbi:hypothetical protein ACF0H5_013109 [Mactra antiquata]
MLLDNTFALFEFDHAVSFGASASWTFIQKQVFVLCALLVIILGDAEISRMSSPPKRHLPDVRYSTRSPVQNSSRKDKLHYGSAGDVTSSFSRMHVYSLGGGRDTCTCTEIKETHEMDTEVQVYADTIDGENREEEDTSNTGQCVTSRTESLRESTGEELACSTLEEVKVKQKIKPEYKGSPEATDLPHFDLALSPRATASDCTGLSVKNLHGLKPHICSGCSVDAPYSCLNRCNETEDTAVDIIDDSLAVAVTLSGTDVDNVVYVDTTINGAHMDNANEPMELTISGTDVDNYEPVESALSGTDVDNNEPIEFALSGTDVDNNEPVEFALSGTDIDNNEPVKFDLSGTDVDNNEPVEFALSGTDIDNNEPVEFALSGTDIDNNEPVEFDLSGTDVVNNEPVEFALSGTDIDNNESVEFDLSGIDVINNEPVKFALSGTDFDNNEPVEFDLSDTDVYDSEPVVLTLSGTDVYDNESNVFALSGTYIDNNESEEVTMSGTDIDNNEPVEVTTSGTDVDLIVDASGDESMQESMDNLKVDDGELNDMDSNVHDADENEGLSIDDNEEVDIADNVNYGEYIVDETLDDNHLEFCDQCIQEESETLGNNDVELEYLNESDENTLDDINEIDQFSWTFCSPLNEEEINVLLDGDLCTPFGENREEDTGQCVATSTITAKEETEVGNGLFDNVDLVDDGHDECSVTIHTPADSKTEQFKEMKTNREQSSEDNGISYFCMKVDTDDYLEDLDAVNTETGTELSDSLTIPEMGSSDNSIENEVFQSDSDYGAVGGEQSEEADVIPGILIKDNTSCSEGTRNTVKFNEEVTVEIFSHEDGFISSTTITELSAGRGPSPISCLRMSSDIDKEEMVADSEFTGSTPLVCTTVRSASMAGDTVPEFSDMTLANFIDNQGQADAAIPDIVSNGFHELVYFGLPNEEAYSNEFVDEHGEPGLMDPLPVTEISEVHTIDQVITDQTPSKDSGIDVSSKIASLHKDSLLLFNSFKPNLQSMQSTSQMNEQTLIYKMKLGYHEDEALAPSMSDSEEFTLSGFDASLYLIKADEEGNTDEDAHDDTSSYPSEQHDDTKCQNTCNILEGQNVDHVSVDSPRVRFSDEVFKISVDDDNDLGTSVEDNADDPNTTELCPSDFDVDTNHMTPVDVADNSITTGNECETEKSSDKRVNGDKCIRNNVDENTDNMKGDNDVDGTRSLTSRMASLKDGINRKRKLDRVQQILYYKSNINNTSHDPPVASVEDKDAGGPCYDNLGTDAFDNDNLGTDAFNNDNLGMDAFDNEENDQHISCINAAFGKYGFESAVDIDSTSTGSDSSSLSKRWSMCVEVPEDNFGNLLLSASSALGDNDDNGDDDDENQGTSVDRINDDCRMNEDDENFLEGSPDRGQRLYGSTQNLDRREGVNVTKRKQAGRSMTPDSRYMLDKEVTESQNRKLQTEIATLQTENRLLKDKYNRSQARITDLETQLSEAQDELNNLQESLNQEVLDLSNKAKHELDRDRGTLESKILKLSKENEVFKSEISSLEKKLESSHRATDLARYNSEKSRTLEAHKSEISSLQEELKRVKSLLEQSERHLKEEEERHINTTKEIVKLTELKNALQQQEDSGGSGIYTEKQLMSLEKRLKVTEDRLHQERADRANNLSAVEDKLLTDNAKLQAAEKELTRQLNREKDKTRNFEQRVKQLREENEKLRLAMPFDDATLLLEKGKYDIPYSSHSNQRAETVKHISDDMNYILSQIEKQDGLQSREEEDIIRVLWNKRELAYQQLREYDLQFQELQITENNKVDGLKNLRDTYGQAESKLSAMEEQLDDARAQLVTLDTTYQQQLNGLVHERHEAFARLKTAEDLLEALRAENDMLHKSLSTNQPPGSIKIPDGQKGKSFDALYAENTSLESKISQLTRDNQLRDGELNTLKIQLEARDKSLKDVQNELDLAYKRLQGDDSDDRKQEKIDKLSTEVNSLQIELRHISERCTHITLENERLLSENNNLKKQAGTQKSKLNKLDQSESKVLQQLHDELSEKEGRLSSITKQFDDLENTLEKTRQDLYVEQMHASELEAECESLQLTVAQRAQMFESLSGSEREQLAQYQILKETLDNVSQELAQKHAMIISLDVNLSGSRDKCIELEEEVRRLRKLKHGANDDDDDDDKDKDNETYSEDEQSSVHQLKIKELEKERGLLKQELEQAYSAIQASEEQYRTLQTESTQLEQELVKEKTVILQLTAEKGEIEQHLEELAEEHDALIQEKTQAEDDLIKLETKLQEILQKYETQARKQHGNFEQEYPNLPPEAHKVVSELESVKLMLDGKEKEVNMLNDKLVRHNIETEFLHRKVELVHNDSIANREDVARMISELTLKMKEAVSTREVNQFLVGERTKLQNEKSHLEKELEMERKNNDQRKKEIQDVIRKIEKTECSQKSSEKNVRNKDNAIVALETELNGCKQELSGIEVENSQLMKKVEHLSEDVKNLTGINTTLENRFEMEKNSLSEEKNNVSKWKEDFTQLSHDYELLQHDHSVLAEKYQSEQQTVANLKKDLEDCEIENTTLKEELDNTKADRDTHKGQLLITKDTVQKLTADKGNIYQDYEGMCRSLTDKERQLTELRERMDEKLESIKHEHAQERARLEQDKTTAVKECEIAKKDADHANEQLRQKEIQLNTFGKTLQDLETVTRVKQQLETQVQQLESSTGDSKLILEGQRKELMSLNEALAKQQHKASKLEAENTTLRADMKAQKETANRESRELNLMITELKSQQENERHYLNDNITQTQTRLRTIEASLATAINDRDSLQAKCCLQERTIEDLETKFSDESTGRRLAEQSVGSLRIQLEDMRNDKNVAEARFVEMKDQLTKAEEKLEKTVENTQSLTTQLQEVNAVFQTSRSSVKAKSEQVEALEKEVNNLKQMLETQKQSLNGKMKKSALESKQRLECMEEEKDKLAMQVQQLSANVDSCREHIASKNKENLKLQEDILTLEDNVREAKLKQKSAEDTLRIEIEKQTELTARYIAQDEELKRLRTFLAKKMEDGTDTDKTMWQEMNRVIQEISHQMSTHLDATRGNGKDKNSDSIGTRLRKQLAELQGELNTEKSLHQITKTSLVALEEDCQRLRKQLHSLRRREPHSGEKRHKNRMEAINAIIARSQSQAQALLASGGYFDDTMTSPRYRTHHSPRVNIHPPMTHRIESPDNSYSEDLSIASLPPMHMSTKKS